MAIAAKPSAYVANDDLTINLPNVYPFSPCCNQMRRSSRNIINKYELRVVPCNVPCQMEIDWVLSKYMVKDSEYMFTLRFMALVGYPRSFIMAKTLVWSIEPKAFLK